MRNIFYLVLLGIALLTIALVVRSGILARSNPGKPITSAMREALADAPKLSESDAQVIAERYPTAEKTPSGLRYIVRSPGSGPSPRLGQEVIAHYHGQLLNGATFDSSFGRAPLTFRVGTGAVIRGWDEAFLTMKKGEKRTLIIPYWLGYGLSGRPPTIPSASTLVFEVEMIDFR